jgi:hypothetical protein
LNQVHRTVALHLLLEIASLARFASGQEIEIAFLQQVPINRMVSQGEPNTAI